MNSYYTVFVIYFVFAVKLQYSLQCPVESRDIKSGFKSSEIMDQSKPITLQNIKDKLKESGIFDFDDNSLSDREKKELSKLFDAVEILTTSRNRQPSNVQTIFSTLRLVERAVKKQLKEDQISESLASKFHWDRLVTNHSMENNVTDASDTLLLSSWNFLILMLGFGLEFQRFFI